MSGLFWECRRVYVRALPSIVPLFHMRMSRAPGVHTSLQIPQEMQLLASSLRVNMILNPGFDRHGTSKPLFLSLGSRFSHELEPPDASEK